MNNETTMPNIREAVNQLRIMTGRNYHIITGRRGYKLVELVDHPQGEGYTDISPILSYRKFALWFKAYTKGYKDGVERRWKDGRNSPL